MSFKIVCLKNIDKRGEHVYPPPELSSNSAQESCDIRLSYSSSIISDTIVPTTDTSMQRFYYQSRSQSYRYFPFFLLLNTEMHLLLPDKYKFFSSFFFFFYLHESSLIDDQEKSIDFVPIQYTGVAIFTRSSSTTLDSFVRQINSTQRFYLLGLQVFYVFQPFWLHIFSITLRLYVLDLTEVHCSFFSRYFLLQVLLEAQLFVIFFLVRNSPLFLPLPNYFRTF